MNPIAVYDFTASCDNITLPDLKELCKRFAKKWCFQQEEGEEGGYKHFQGRVSLKVRQRLPTVVKQWSHGIHWSPTCSTNLGNDFYASKEDTRIDGPWRDDDEEVYIPRQIREIENLYPWQNAIVQLKDQYDPRTVHCIVDHKGNNGKSILCTYMAVHKYGRKLPYCNDYKDIMRMVMDLPKSKVYLIDMPRALKKERLQQMYSAIEDLKNGHAFDDRYKYREEFFDSPQVVVFTNHCPDASMLSADRWSLWAIDDEMQLVDYHYYKEL